MRRFVLYLCTIALFAIGLSSTANAVPQPFLQARSLGFSNATSSSVQVNWTRGAGQRVILIVKSGAGSFDNAGFTDQPEDGQSEAVPPMTWDVDPPYTNVGDEGDFSNAGSNWDKGGAVVVYEGTGTSVTVTGLTPNTTYTFKVMELNSSTTPAADNPNFAHNVFQQSERQFTTPLGAPTGLFADDIMATQANLNWNAVTGATGYQIQVATDLAMTNVLPGYNVLDVGTNLEWLVTGLTQQTQYHYRVRAYLNSQYTGWSDVATFTTDQDIDPPSVQALIPDAEGSVNSTVVNDGTAAYIGDQFTLTVDYSETMNYFGSANPTLVFNPSVASTLTLLYGYWSDTDKYTAVYSVADADVETAVDVTVNGGEDLAGNSHGTTNFDDNFFIDTKAPIISNLELINPSDDNCVKEGTVVEYRFEVVEEGYGTFNQDDITISENLTLQNPAGQQFVSQTGSGSVANPYVFTYEYTVVGDDNALDPSEIEYQIDASDDAGNDATQYTEPAFINIDGTAPVFSDLTFTSSNCVKSGDLLEFNFEVFDDGCGTFDENNVTIQSTPALTNAFTNASVSSNGTGTYTFYYTVLIDNDDADDSYDIEIGGFDDAGNIAATVDEINVTDAFAIDNDPLELDNYDNETAGDETCLQDGDTFAFAFDVSGITCGVFDENDITVGLSSTGSVTLSASFSGATGTDANGNGTYHYLIPVSDDDNGQVEIQITATDPSGNVATYDPLPTPEFAADNDAPAVSNYSNLNPTVCAGPNLPVMFSFEVIETGCGSLDETNISLTTNPAGLANSASLSGITGAGTPGDPFVVTYTWDIDAGDTEDDYQILYTVTDDAGNSTGGNFQGAGVIEFTVDNTAPDLANFSIPGGCVTAGGSLQLSFEATDGGCGTFDENDITINTSPSLAGGSIDFLQIVGSTYIYEINVTEFDPAGPIDVVVVASDDAGNLTTLDPATPDFEIDNLAPVIQNFAVDKSCVMEGEYAEITFEIVEDPAQSCGTFDENDVSVTLTPASGSLNGSLSLVSVDGDGSAGDPYDFTYRYTVDPSDPEVAVDVTVNATDDSGNEATTVSPAGTEFTIDITDPAITNLSVDKTCVSGAPDNNVVQVSFFVTENGCGVFDTDDITVDYDPAAGDVADPVNTNIFFDGSKYILTYNITLDGTEANQTVNVRVQAQDDAGNISTATGVSFDIDNIDPAVANLQVDEPCVGVGDDVTLWFDLSDTGCGSLDASNVTVTPAPGLNNSFDLSSMVGGSATYTYSVHPNDPEGNIDLTIEVTDDAGNSATLAPSGAEFFIDKSAPVLGNLDVTPECVTSSDLVTITFEAVGISCGTFDENDITVELTPSSGSLNNTPQFQGPIGGTGMEGSPYVFTYTYLIDAGDPTGPVDVTINASDDAGNISTPVSENGAFTIDNDAPSISNFAVSDDPVCAMDGDVVNFTFDLTELGCGTFDQNDITVILNTPEANDISATYVSGSGSGTYEYSYTVDAAHGTGGVEVVIDASDDSGNNMPQASNSNAFNIDNTAPDVTAITPSGDGCHEGGETVSFTVTILEDDCGTFDENDITVQLTNENGALVNSVVFSGMSGANDYVYTYLVDDNDPSGNVTVDVTAQDDAGNVGTNLLTNMFAIDNAPPVLTNLEASPSCINGGTQLTITFDAEEDGCGTFDQNNITLSVSGPQPLTNSPVFSGVSGDTYTYTLDIDAGDNDGYYDIVVDATDAAGTSATTLNPAGEEFRIDNTAPVLDAFAVTTPNCANAGDLVEFQFTVAENGCGTFDENNITVNISSSGGALTNSVSFISGGPGAGVYTYGYLVDANDPDGEVNITVDATDPAGNDAVQLVPSGFEFLIDNTAPDIDNFTLDTDFCAYDGDVASFTFEVVENIGSGACDVFDENNLTVTAVGDIAAQPVFSGVSETSNTFTFTYTLNIGPADSGPIDIQIDAIDAAGNNATQYTESPALTVDNVAPVLSDFSIINQGGDGLCVNAGQIMEIVFDASDVDGCGTFDENNITVTVENELTGNELENSPATFSSRNGNSFTFTYEVDANDPDGEVEVYVDAADDAGNMATTLDPLGEEFSVDNTDPILQNLVAESTTCLGPNSPTFEFYFEVIEQGCGVFNEEDITFTIPGVANTPVLAYIAGSGTPGSPWEFHYTLDLTGATPGAIDISVDADDDATNSATTLQNASIAEYDDSEPVIDDFTIDPLCASAETVTFTVEANDAAGFACGTFDENDITLTLSSGGTLNNSVSFVSANSGTYTYSYLVDPDDSDGTVTADLSVGDDAGNLTTTSGTFTIDNNGPVITDVQVSNTCNDDFTDIEIEITVEDDGCGTWDADNFTVSTGLSGSFGTPTFSDNSPTYTYSTTFTPDGNNDDGDSFDITIDVEDPSGNLTTQVLTDEVTIDKTAPDVTVSSDPSGCIAPGTEITYTVSVIDGGCGTWDENNLSIVLGTAFGQAPPQIPPDNAYGTLNYTGMSGAGTGGDPYEFTYTYTPTENDFYEHETCPVDLIFYAEVTDNAGNVGDDSYVLELDGEEPYLDNIVKVGETCENDGTIQIEFEAEDDCCGTFDEDDLTVTVTGNGFSRTATYSGISGTTFTYNFDILPGDGDGPVDVTVDASDDAGNTSSLTATDLFDIDNTDPVIQNINLVSGPCTSDDEDVVITFEVIEEGCGSFDADDASITGPAGGLTNSWTFSILSGNGSSGTPYVIQATLVTTSGDSEGSYSFNIEVGDNAGGEPGNVAVVNSAGSFTIDNTDPVISNFNIPSGICTRQGQYVNFTFDATDTGGCGDFDENDITIIVRDDDTETPLANNVQFLSKTLNTYSYRILIDATDPTGPADIVITASDDGGNEVSVEQDQAFGIDNTAPELSNYVNVTGPCVSPGQTVEIEFDASDIGCGTFNENDLDVQATPQGGGSLFNGPTITFVSGTTYRAEIPIHPLDPEDAIDVVISATDDAGNTAIPIEQAAAFTIDKTQPILADLNVENTCASEGTDLIITFEATENGCGSFDPSNLTVALSGAISTNATFSEVSGGATQLFTYYYTVTGSETSGNVTVTVDGQDDAGNNANTTLSQTNAFYIDNDPPVNDNLTLTSVKTCVMDGDDIVFTFDASDVGCGTFDENDITIDFTPAVTNSPVLVETSPGVWEATLTIDAGDTDGERDIAVSVMDDAGNEATPALTQTISDAFSVDNTAPAFAANSMSADITCANETDEVTFTFVVNETGCGTFDQNDISVTLTPSSGSLNGSYSFVSQSTNTFTYAYNVDPADPTTAVNISVVAEDDAGNVSSVFDPAGIEFNIDNTDPEISNFSIPAEDLCVSAGSDVNLNFDASDIGCGVFDEDDLTVTVNGTPATFGDRTGDTYNYIYTVPGGATTDDYDIVIQASDDAGNTATPYTEAAAFSIDNDPPVLADLQLEAGQDECVNDGSTVVFEFNAGDSGCGTFDENDINVTLSNGGILINNAEFSAENSGVFTYTVDITEFDSNGPVSVEVTATDDAGNTATPISDASLFSIDNSDPVVSNMNTDVDCVAGDETVTITFDVTDTGCGSTGFDENNLTVNVIGTGAINGTTSFSSVNLSGGVYTYTYTYTADVTDDSGPANVTVLAEDNAGNMMGSAYNPVGYEFRIDNDPPQLSDLTLDKTCVGDNNTVNIQFVVTETGCGTFNSDDIEVTVTDVANGSPASASYVSGTGSGTYTYSYTVNSATDGEGNANVVVTAEDDGGNIVTLNPAGAEFEIDLTAPALSWDTISETCAGGGTTITFSFGVTETGCGTFDQNNLTVDLTSTGTLNNSVSFVEENSGIYTYSYLIDEGDATGDVQIVVYAEDEAGNDASLDPAGIEFSVDNTEPNVGNMVITDGECVSGTDVVTIEFTASDIGCGTFDENNISVTLQGPDETLENAASYSSNNGSTFTYTWTVGNTDLTGQYNVYVQAEDYSGNMSAPYSAPGTEINVDNDSPVISGFNMTSGTCLMEGETATFEFDVTDAGCGTFDENDITVGISGAGALNGTSAVSLISGSTYGGSYTIAAGDPSGDVNITVQASDSHGNTSDLTDPAGAEFYIDNTKPELSSLTVDGPTCATGDDEVTFSFVATENGCGTFDENDITVTVTGNGTLNGNIEYVSGGSGSGTYTYSYTVDPSDPTGAVNISVEASDDAGNIATVLAPGGTEFSIDNTAPTVESYSDDAECVTSGDVVTITFDANDIGCGSTDFSTGNLTVEVVGSNPLTGSVTNIAGPVGGGTYEYEYEVESTDPDADVNVIITATDNVGNTFTFEPAGIEFTIDNNAPEISEYSVDGQNCFSDGETVTFTFEVVEEGCGVFDETNIDISETLIDDATFVSMSGEGTVNNPYVFTYTIDIAGEATDDYDITITATDDGGAEDVFVGTISVDNTDPEVSNVAIDPMYLCVGSGETVEFTFDASDIGCGTFDNTNLEVSVPNEYTNSPQISSETNGNYTYTFVVNPTDPDGLVDVTIVATDDAGNTVTYNADELFGIDNSAPAIGGITVDETCVSGGTTVTIEFTAEDTGFSCGTFDEDDISVSLVTGGTLNNSVSFSGATGTTYTYTYLIDNADSQGAVDVSVEATDDAGNTGTSELIDAFVIDNVAPVLSNLEATPPTCVGEGATVTLSFTASEVGTCGTFDEDDVTVTLSGAATGTATFSDIVGATMYYTYTVLPGDGNGAVNVDVDAEDDAGNAATTLTVNGLFDIDKSSPLLSNFSLTSDDCVSGGDMVIFEFDAEDTGCGTFDESDLTVTLTGQDGVLSNVAEFSEVDNNTYTYYAMISSADADGGVNVTVDATDDAGNSASTLDPGGFEFNIDNTAPVISNLNVAPECVSGVTELTITFEVTEDGCGVFDQNDITFSGLGGIQNSPDFDSSNDLGGGVTEFTYTLDVLLTDNNGTYDLTVGATDDAGNTATEATDQFIVDNIGPQLSDLFAEPNCVNGDDIVTITFEAIEEGCGSFDQDNMTVTLTGNTIDETATFSGMSGAGTSLDPYIVTYTWDVDDLDPDENINISVDATDDAGNTATTLNPAGTEFTIDNTDPVINSISTANGTCFNGNDVVEILLEIDEEGCGTLDEDNIDITLTPSAGTLGGTLSYQGRNGTTFTYFYDIASGDPNANVTFDLTVTDDAGNEATDQEALLFSIDNSAPVLDAFSMTSETCVNAADGTVEFTFTVDEEGCGTFDTDDITIGGSGSTLGTINGSSNNGGILTFTYTIDISGTTTGDDGDYNLTVQAMDDAGNMSNMLNPAGIEFSIDNTSPDVSNMNVTNGTCFGPGSSVEFQFDVTEEGCGTFGEDDITINFIGGTITASASHSAGSGSGTYYYSLLIDAADDGGTYDIQVLTEDAAGNTNSQTFSSQFTVDTDAPTLGGLNVTGETCVSGEDEDVVTFEFSAEDDGGCGTFDEDNFTITYIGTAPGTYNGSTNWQYIGGGNWSATYSVLPTDQNGDVEIEITAMDDAGNVSTINLLQAFTIDNIEPTVTGVTVTENACVTDSDPIVEFTVNVSDDGCGTFAQEDITINFTSESGTFTADEVFVNSTGGTVFNYTVDGSGQPSGPVDIEVQVSDPAGNVSTLFVEEDAFIVDNTAPVISSLSYTGDECVMADETVTFDVVASDVDGCGTFDENNLTVTINSNATSFISSTGTTFTYEYTTMASDEGQIDIDVTATDDAGNTASDTFTDVFNVDASAPVINESLIEISNDCVSEGTTFMVTMQITDNEVCAELDQNNITVTVNGNEMNYVNNSSQIWQYEYTVQSSDPEGLTDISVTVTDEAGNTSSYTYVDALTVDKTTPALSGLEVSPECANDGTELTITFNAIEEGCGTFDQDDLTVTVNGSAATHTGGSGSGTYSYSYTLNEGTTENVDVDVMASDDAGNSSSTTTQVFVDNDDPNVSTATLIEPETTECIASGDAITFEFTASDIGCGTFDQNDLSVTVNGNNASFDDVDGTTYTYIYTVGGGDSGELDVTVEATDDAGNTETVVTTAIATVDNDPPVLSNLSLSDDCATEGDEITITFDAQDDGCGTFDENELTVQVGTGYASYVSGPTGSFTYTFTYTIQSSDNGALGVIVSAEDDAGNSSTQNLTDAIDVDKTAPTLSNLQVLGNDCVAEFRNVDFTFEVVEDGCGTFGQDDMTVTVSPALVQGAQASYVSLLSGSGTSSNPYVYQYRVEVQAGDDDGPYTITVNAEDEAGNVSTPLVGNDAFTVDTQAPELSNLQVTSSTCIADGGQVVVTFDAVENGCGTFDQNDIDVSVTGGTLTNGFSFSSVSGDTYTYVLDITNDDESGTYGVQVEAEDDVNNISTISLGSAFTVDNDPPSLSNITPPQETCYGEGDEVTMTFTASDLGCGTFDENNMTVSLTGQGSIGTAVITNTGGDNYQITYTVLSTDASGDVDVTVTADDDAGTGPTSTTLDNAFTIDNSAPVIADFNITSSTCVSGGTSVTFEFEATDSGCGTFDQTDIQITGTGSLNNDADFVGQSGNVYSYSIDIVNGDPDGPVNLTITATDSEGNVTTENYNSAFEVDNTAPVVSNLSADPSVASGGQTVTITFNTTEMGCGIFDQNDLIVTTNPTLANSPVFSSVTGTGNPYQFTYTVLIDNNDPNGQVDVIVNGQDDAGNTLATFTANNAFEINNVTANPIVTTLVPNIGNITDGDAGNQFTLTINYNQNMNTSITPTVTLDPALTNTLINRGGSWASATQYVWTATVFDNNICQNDVDVTVSGAESTGGNTQTTYNGTSVFDVTMCPGPAGSDIVAVAGSEASGISSTTTGTPVQVWEIIVRDDIQGDDLNNTILTSLTLTEDGSNTADFDTYIGTAQLYDGATLVATGTVSGTEIEFNGINVTVNDNSTKTLELRLALNTNIPDADGRRFVFNITDADVTSGPGSTPFISFSQTSSAGGTDNLIQVDATTLAFSTQPSDTEVGQIAPTFVVWAADANGNRDKDVSGTVNLTANGTTISSGSSKAMTSGESSFNSTIFGTATPNATLTATITGATLTQATSNSFVVRAAEPNQASNTTYVSRTRNTIQFDWQNNGGRALVIGIEGSYTDYMNESDNLPIDGTNYGASANSDFSSAGSFNGNSDLKILYAGSGNNMTFSGLTQNTTYTFVVFAYGIAVPSLDPVTANYNPTITQNSNTITRTTSFIKEGVEYASVELKDFDAYAKDMAVELDWETKSEMDNAGFELFRAYISEAGVGEFVKIADYTRNGELIGLGSSEYGRSYKYTDNDEFEIGDQYVYRLVGVARDGYRTYLGERNVRITGVTEISVSEVRPNPVVDKLSFTLTLEQAAEVTVELINLTGETMMIPVSGELYQPGTSTIEFPVDGNKIASGTYGLKITAGGETIIKRFVISR